MNSRAGGRLCPRNPSREPTISRRKPATKNCGWWLSGRGAKRAAAARIAAAIAATPADRPSMLSSMLNELTRPTIHSTLTTKASHWPGTMYPWSHGRRTHHPQPTIVAATAACAARRNRQSSPRRSSTSPRIISAVPPPSSSQSLSDCCHRPGRWAARPEAARNGGSVAPSRRIQSRHCPRPSGTTRPSQIANPPLVGIGFSWIFRVPGRSTRPARGPSRRTIQAAIQQTQALGTTAERISHGSMRTPLIG